MGLFDFLKKDKDSKDKLTQGLSKSNKKLSVGLSSIFLGKKQINEELLNKIEEHLITSDIGIKATDIIIEGIKAELTHGILKGPEQITDAIKLIIKDILNSCQPSDNMNITPHTILVVGVNGVGKTTSIAKLANMYQKYDKSVILAAGDTFRAAATEQLTIWASKLNIPIVKHKENSDPAAVIYDGATTAKAKNIDIFIADTAGRIHTKNNLMQELIKINKVLNKEIDAAPHEKLLVLDATTGQNGISQVKHFHQAIGITGIILTKIDGTAKGGIVVNIVKEVGIPIKYIGFGEDINDLRLFDVDDFVEGLFK